MAGRSPAAGGARYPLRAIAVGRTTDLLDRGLVEAEAAIDWLKYHLRQRRAPGRFHIQPYRGHGTANRLYISGRVFQGIPIPPARANDSRFRNLWHTVRRLGIDDVPAARVMATAGAVSHTVLTDDEGYFEFSLPATTIPGAEEVWREVLFELIDPVPPDGRVTARGFAIVPPAQARFGIISDIDDTVVETDVANLLRMLRLVLLTNAHTRLPFAGVSAFYRALHAGPAGPFTNPIFYVSSSPWNFYDLLTEVFEVHEIPVGPLFLKDYGLARDLLLSRGHMEHKLACIGHILDTHPQLSFVLVGDSGQKDPEVYREAAYRHPGRITAVYIRDVSTLHRDHEIDSIAEDLVAHGVEMVRVNDTLAAAEHAARTGLIDPAALAGCARRARRRSRFAGSVRHLLDRRTLRPSRPLMGARGLFSGGIDTPRPGRLIANQSRIPAVRSLLLLRRCTWDPLPPSQPIGSATSYSSAMAGPVRRLSSTPAVTPPAPPGATDPPTKAPPSPCSPPKRSPTAISMNCSVAYAEWMDHKINFIDTPGYLDFVGETKAGVRVADGAVVVLAGPSGVEVGTERVWEMLRTDSFRRSSSSP
jgi:phosphatidate phosphatase APP1